MLRPWHTRRLDRESRRRYGRDVPIVKSKPAPLFAQHSVRGREQRCWQATRQIGERQRRQAGSKTTRVKVAVVVPGLEYVWGNVASNQALSPEGTSTCR